MEAMIQQCYVDMTRDKVSLSLLLAKVERKEREREKKERKKEVEQAETEERLIRNAQLSGASSY